MGRLMGGNAVYLVDHYTYKPPDELRVHAAETEKAYYAKPGWQLVSEEEKEFVRMIWTRAGLKDHTTYIPAHIHPVLSDAPRTDLKAAHEEAEMTVLGSVDGLFEKTGVKPADIDIIVTACSIFCPTPSIASMIVNKYKMKSSIHSYSLGGMGCGAGVFAIGLVRDLLKAHPNSNCLFVTTEVTTSAFYKGREKHRLVANAIFRMGGAAVLLSNKPSYRRHAKYKLAHAVRVHSGADDASYSCIDMSPDEDGHYGIYLDRSVVKVAGKTVEQALRKIIPKVLTARQLMEGAKNIIQRKWLKKDVPEYVPDLTKCIHHFCVHAGSTKIIDGLQDSLHLPEGTMVSSNTALQEYGNTSASTTWYALAHAESSKGIKRGEKVMQIGMGAGIKAGVNVWKALRKVKDVHASWKHLVLDPPTDWTAISVDQVQKELKPIQADAAKVVPVSGGEQPSSDRTTNSADHDQEKLKPILADMKKMVDVTKPVLGGELPSLDKKANGDDQDKKELNPILADKKKMVDIPEPVSGRQQPSSDRVTNSADPGEEELKPMLANTENMGDGIKPASDGEQSCSGRTTNSGDKIQEELKTDTC